MRIREKDDQSLVNILATGEKIEMTILVIFSQIEDNIFLIISCFLPHFSRKLTYSANPAGILTSVIK